jgi:hypothetical protein
MKCVQTQVTMQAGGKERALFMIDEDPRKDGDVFIKIRTGLQVGVQPNHTLVRQQRFSVHPSHRSKEFSSIKHTLELVDGRREETVQMSDAVKLKTGVAPVFSLRYGDLSDKRYNVTQAKGFDKLNLGDFDPKTGTPIVSVFVTHHDFDAPAVCDFGVIHEVRTSLFLLLIVVAYFPIQSFPASWTISSITERAPEDDDHARERMRIRMTGLSLPEMYAHLEMTNSFLFLDLVETVVQNCDAAIVPPHFPALLEQLRSKFESQFPGERRLSKFGANVPVIDESS